MPLPLVESVVRGLQPEPGPARELLRRELSRADYQPTLLERAQRRIGDLIDRVVGSVEGAGALSITTLLVLAAVLAIALLLLLSRLRPDTRSGEPEPVLGDSTRTAAEHRERARRALAEQQWDQAVIESLRAIARDLEERSEAGGGVRPGLTAREVVGLARARFPGRDDDLDALGRSFEDVVYGDRRAVSGEAERSVSTAEDLARAAPSSGSGPVRQAAPQ